MSNNNVHLIGWMEIERVEMLALDGDVPQPVIHAWLYTDKAYFGGKHPILLSGQPAVITLEWARQSDPKAGLPQVIINGRLVSRQESTAVLVKFISFVGTLNPSVRSIVIRLARLFRQNGDSRLRSEVLRLLQEEDRDLAQVYEQAELGLLGEGAETA